MHSKHYGRGIETMFTREEKAVLKELVLLEIDEVKSFLDDAIDIDVDDLRQQVDVLERILKKLK